MPKKQKPQTKFRRELQERVRTAGHQRPLWPRGVKARHHWWPTRILKKSDCQLHYYFHLIGRATLIHFLKFCQGYGYLIGYAYLIVYSHLSNKLTGPFIYWTKKINPDTLIRPARLLNLQKICILPVYYMLY